MKTMSVFYNLGVLKFCENKKNKICFIMIGTIFMEVGHFNYFLLYCPYITVRYNTDK